MVNDRVNCNEVYYFLDIQTPYKLTTFFVCCSGFLEGEVPRVQQRKFLKSVYFSIIMCTFVA